jgi:hypothetical protein
MLRCTSRNALCVERVVYVVDNSIEEWYRGIGG